MKLLGEAVQLFREAMVDRGGEGAEARPRFHGGVLVGRLRRDGGQGCLGADFSHLLQYMGKLVCGSYKVNEGE